MHPPSLVLVEDSEADVRLVETARDVVDEGVPLLVFGTGESALDYLDTQTGKSALLKQVIVLLDLNLPGIDGFTVLRSIRENPRFRALPVIVMSSSDDRRDIKTAYAQGANAYIVKPFGLVEYIEVFTNFREFWLRHVVLP